jgi:hypothetical protein
MQDGVFFMIKKNGVGLEADKKKESHIGCQFV